jgi:hypothetical protein
MTGVPTEYNLTNDQPVTASRNNRYQITRSTPFLEYLYTMRINACNFKTCLVICAIREIYQRQKESRGNAVGIATCYRMNDPKRPSSSPCRVNTFHFSMSSGVWTSSAAHPAFYPMGKRGRFAPRGKRSGRKAPLSPITVDQTMKMWVHTLAPPYDLKAP